MGLARTLPFIGFMASRTSWGSATSQGHTILTMTVSPPDPGSTVYRLRLQPFRGTEMRPIQGSVTVLSPSDRAKDSDLPSGPRGMGGGEGVESLPSGLAE